MKSLFAITALTLLSLGCSCNCDKEDEQFGPEPGDSVQKEAPQGPLSTQTPVQASAASPVKDK